MEAEGDRKQIFWDMGAGGRVSMWMC